MTIRERLEAIITGDLSSAREHAVAALRELGEMEAAMKVLYEYAGIGTERPPEHVFAALRKLHGVPDPVAAATPLTDDEKHALAHAKRRPPSGTSPVVWSTKEPEDMIGEESSPPSGT